MPFQPMAVKAQLLRYQTRMKQWATENADQGAIAGLHAEYVAFLEKSLLESLKWHNCHGGEEEEAVVTDSGIPSLQKNYMTTL